jgi:hypothetical protein
VSKAVQRLAGKPQAGQVRRRQQLQQAQDYVIRQPSQHTQAYSSSSSSTHGYLNQRQREVSNALSCVKVCQLQW